jgi:NADPH:quinone reductase
MPAAMAGCNEEGKKANMNTESETMMAARIHAYGGVENLVCESAPRPRPGQGEVLVQVLGAGVNPVDWKTRQGGGIAGMLPGIFPLILGWDVSGRIAALGPDAGKFRIGDEVYGMIRFPKAGGAYAQFATAPEGHLALKPPGLDHARAAAMPLAALTAFQALFEAADLRAGQKILIHAAAGGVGHFAVQLAKWKGAYVAGTASARNLDFLRGLGVDAPFDYASGPFESALRDFDVVLDTVGGLVADRSYASLKKGGILVSIAGGGSQDKAKANEVRHAGLLVRPESGQLVKLAELVGQGRLRPEVEAVFPLADAGKAHVLGHKGHVRGKLSLSLEEPPR